MKLLLLVFLLSFSILAVEKHLPDGIPNKKESHAENSAPPKIHNYNDSKATHSPHWGYNSQTDTSPSIVPPSDWYHINENCREGRENARQSPIDIPVSKTPKNETSLPKQVELDYFDKEAITFDVFHNRHAVQATVNAKKDRKSVV